MKGFFRISALVLTMLACMNSVSGAGDVPGRESLVARVMDGLEARFGKRSFSADFTQESSLKALDIVDTARGRVWFKYPGRMRWEYLSPEKYEIITDGKTLWVYRPADRQVVIGDAAAYFSNGKGASFLSDMREIRSAFHVSASEDGNGGCTLTLVPLRKQADISSIAVHLSLPGFEIRDVVTRNEYGDETVITFDNIRFDPHMDDGLFRFSIPPGTDVIRMEQ